MLSKVLEGQENWALIPVPFHTIHMALTPTTFLSTSVWLQIWENFSDLCTRAE